MKSRYGDGSLQFWTRDWWAIFWIRGRVHLGIFIHPRDWWNMTIHRWDNRVDYEVGPIQFWLEKE